MGLKMRDHRKYSVVFHYNTYISTWFCVPNESYNRYFNVPMEEKREKYGMGGTTVEAYKNYLTKQK